jgi:hypothetical protein
MTTEIRKALRKKLTRLLKKHKKLKIFWSTAKSFFDMRIQTPKGRNILLPYAYYQFFQQKIFQIIDFPEYALDRTSAFKSAGSGKIYIGKKKQIIGEYKFSTNCGNLEHLEKPKEELENQNFYFDFDDKFRLAKYNKNFEIELWLRYDYLFELDVFSAEFVATPKNENNTKTFRISKKAQNYWIETARIFSKPLYAQEKHEFYSPPTISKIHKYRFPKQAICKPFLFGINVSSKIIASNQMLITLHRDYEYINFKRESMVLL